MDIGNLLFSFDGRVNRGKYWLAVLIYFVVYLIVGGLVFVTGMSIISLIVAGIIFIVAVISGIAVGIKRLHDRDKSGWWLLVFYLVPSLLSGLGQGIGLPAANIVFGLASFAVSIWALVELGFLRGTAGTNRFGADPIAAIGTAAI